MDEEIWKEKILWILGKANAATLRRCYILLLELIGKENILGVEHEEEKCAFVENL